jgi:hypothetical protein
MLLYGRTPKIPRYLLNPPDDFELYFIDPITYIEEKMNTLKAQGEIVELTNQKKERY